MAQTRKQKKSNLSTASQKTTQKCPICQEKIVFPNCYVRYHVRYKPPIVILACKYCNATEYKIRKGHSLSPAMAKRAKSVLDFQKSILNLSSVRSF